MTTADITIPEYWTREWWPLCAKCGTVVEDLRSVPLPPNSNAYQKVVRDYIVTCHGDTEKSMVGIWSAFEIIRGCGRLPTAFYESKEKQLTP